MEDCKYELLSNKMNNSLFKFLMREYYSHTIDPFFCLKLLSKIYHTKITDKLKEKCASFLFTILQELNITEQMQENITPIINDMLDNVLTRKADYPIVLYYSFFLIHIGNVQKAITTIQIFSNENRFMNSGEILFYKALIEYVIEKKTEAIYFVRGIEKAIPLIKHNKNSFYIWILDFCIDKRMNYEIKDTLMKNGYLNTHMNNVNKEKLYIIKLLLNDEDDSINRLEVLSKALVNNSFNYSLLEKVKELAISYYQENLFSSNNSSIVYLLKSIDENALYDYVSFLFTYYIYQPYEEKCYKEIKEVLDDINKIINSKEPILKVRLFSNEELYYLFKASIISFYKNVIFLILKQKIKKEIIYHLNLNEQEKKPSFISKIVNCLNIINITKEIITGSQLLIISNEVRDNIMTRLFVKYISTLTI